MGDVCEMAWHQGLDLYAPLENRLLQGFEYTARYELGEDVSFTADRDRTGKDVHTEISERSPLRPVFEPIYNHYVHRAGIAAPFTQRAAEKIRPEGAGWEADHTGFGTLLYSRGGPDPLAALPAGPAGLHVKGDPEMVAVTWVPLRSSPSYRVERFESRVGSFHTIARGVEYSNTWIAPS